MKASNGNENIIKNIFSENFQKVLQNLFFSNLGTFSNLILKEQKLLRRYTRCLMYTEFQFEKVKMKSCIIFGCFNKTLVDK